MNNLFKEIRENAKELSLGVGWLNEDSLLEDIMKMKLKSAEVLALIKHLEYDKEAKNALAKKA